MAVRGAKKRPGEGSYALTTTIRHDRLTLPAAPLGAVNPLAPLRPLDETHTIDPATVPGLPQDMARGLTFAPLTSLLPTRVLDGYERRRVPTALPSLVLENSRLRATVLPGLGGRVHSLFHKPTGRELLYRNPVFQPADFALNGAWYSGGIEWNIGATGHTTLSCAPLHAARVPAPDGGEMLRLWEWERLRDLPFQVDLWLPEDSDFLLVGVRVRNPHLTTAPLYWWSNTAVPEEHRVLTPADAAWHFGYERRLRRVPFPHHDGADRSHPAQSQHPADYFHDPRDPAGRPWIAALGGDGHGLVQTSTGELPGRKLFVWGSGPGGRRWQEWLTEPGTGGYAEIQAGLARTQLEHVPLPAGAETAWLEAYGPLHVDPGAAHGPDWAAATLETGAVLDRVLPAEELAAARDAWRAVADAPPGERLATGSAWGALEVRRAALDLPGTPFDDAPGPEQRPWSALLDTGALPAKAPGPEQDPGPTLVSPAWRDLLETAPPAPLTEYHLGVAQWHAGDLAQAVRSWERALTAPGAADAARWPALRALAVADTAARHRVRAAERYAEALADALARRGTPDGEDPDDEPSPLIAALVREAVPALLAADRAGAAREAYGRLHPATRARGRFRLTEARLLLAEGEREAALAVFARGFEVADLREGDEVLSETWAQLSDEPLAAAYDFRMRPAGREG
ncbi:DUF5107 domain-containing protein [Streptomyces albidoflavus]|uniref:DUF5107 domain-containing protein n=1 Tax=Streptomyces albidoflavus TaxID=1886 RepID=UPI0033233A83